MYKQLEVAIVSSNLRNRQHVAAMLSRLGIDSTCLSTVDQCRQIPGRLKLDLVFCDRQLKDGDYRDVLSAFLSSSPAKAPRVVMMSDVANPEEYKEIRSQGLFDVISCPSRPTDVEWMVILAKRDGQAQTKQLGNSHDLSVMERTARVGA